MSVNDLIPNRYCAGLCCDCVCCGLWLWAVALGCTCGYCLWLCSDSFNLFLFLFLFLSVVCVSQTAVQRTLLSSDLLLRILSFGFSNAYMLCGAWATVCRAWHSAIVLHPKTSSAQTLWQAVSRHTWPHLPLQLKVNNWMLFYQRRVCTLSTLIRGGQELSSEHKTKLTAPLPIENCEVALLYVLLRLCSALLCPSLPPSPLPSLARFLPFAFD
jgi:hypothetical protein